MFMQAHYEGERLNDYLVYFGSTAARRRSSAPSHGNSRGLY